MLLEDGVAATAGEEITAARPDTAVTSTRIIVGDSVGGIQVVT
jgi:hypothetical protein